MKLYYFSGWNAPKIRYCQRPSQAWQSAATRPTQRRNWHLFEWGKTAPVEFVFADEAERQWDNPPALSRAASKSGKNYFLDAKAAVYTLVDGEVTAVEGPAICICTDLDGTLLGHGEELRRFVDLWKRQLLWRGSLLMYSTGRNLKDMLRAAHDFQLPQPDFAICGVGTEIYTFPANKTASDIETCLKLRQVLERALLTEITPEDAVLQDDDLVFPSWCASREDAVFDAEWLEKNLASFDRKACVAEVEAISEKLIVRGNGYHDPFRVALSVRHEDLLELLRKKASDLDSDLTSATMMEESQAEDVGALTKLFPKRSVLLSGEGEWRFLDILPAHGGKLHPLLHLLKKTGFPAENTLVCGDSGNDVDMFAHDGLKGVAVGNSQRELLDFLGRRGCLAASRGLKPTSQVYFATGFCAAGILEAFRHFEWAT